MSPRPSHRSFCDLVPSVVGMSFSRASASYGQSRSRVIWLDLRPIPTPVGMGLVLRARDPSHGLKSDAEMSGGKRGNITENLRSMLGDEQFLSLLENYAGTRLFIPAYQGDRTHVIDGLTAEASQELADVYGGLYLRVPLARDFRAETYRARGLTVTQIAMKLGITERGAERLLARQMDIATVAMKPARKLIGAAGT